MAKYAVPGTVVIGATLFHKDGKLQWYMPDPISYQIHKTKPRPTRVPIYRGVSAKLANQMRSAAKRNAHIDLIGTNP